MKVIGKGGGGFVVGDNEVVRVEKTAVHCAARMRKNHRQTEKR